MGEVATTVKSAKSNKAADDDRITLISYEQVVLP